ncbi:MAG: hypothetical protein IH795_07940 [Bacteroidetes bacterium]|nr:hypothetical protein [Bacteroidota bacterium]
MDWDGIFSETYNFIEDECNILIFDLKRVLVYQSSGKDIDKTKLNEILEILRKLNN